MSRRLTEQQRSWLLKMPSWTAVRGEDILRHLDGLVAENAKQRDENQRLRAALKLIASGHGPPPKEQAREALAGDAE